MNNVMEKPHKAELIKQIADYKKKFMMAAMENLLKERQQRHVKGEVFYKGHWIPQNHVSTFQKYLIKKSRIVFIEIHIVILMILLLDYALWIIFKKFLLP